MITISRTAGCISKACNTYKLHPKLGWRTTLNELYRAIQVALAENDVQFDRDPVYREFRAGDVRPLENGKYDAVILAVAHHQFKDMGVQAIRALGKSEHVLYDNPDTVPTH